MAVDHYNTLGAFPNATAADLRTAYLKLARANHPDMFEGHERDQAHARMQQINEAWNVLGVAHKRREYDAALPKSQSRTTGPNPATGQRGHAHFRPFDDTDDFDSSRQADVDLDARPISGSKGVPRWVTFMPVAFFVFGVVVMAVGTVVNAAGVFALGLIALGLGAVCFLMMPLVVMSRAERDPDL